MIVKNSWYDAVSRRTSRRTYQNDGIAFPQSEEQIQTLIDEANSESGLHIQLIKDGEQFLSGFRSSYGLISGKPAMIALAGSLEDPELKRKIGYYGEFIVLECTALHLGTCWIGGTYDRKKSRQAMELNGNQELIAVLAVGRVAESKNVKERIVAAMNGKKLSFDELLSEKDEVLPQWVSSGIEAARLSPSAVNGQPVRYRYQNQKLTAFLAKKNHGSEMTDLGISMANFEVGAAQAGKHGSWIQQEDGYSFL